MAAAIGDLEGQAADTRARAEDLARKPPVTPKDLEDALQHSRAQRIAGTLGGPVGAAIVSSAAKRRQVEAVAKVLDVDPVLAEAIVRTGQGRAASWIAGPAAGLVAKKRADQERREAAAAVTDNPDLNLSTGDVKKIQKSELLADKIRSRGMPKNEALRFQGEQSRARKGQPITRRKAN